jgi:hypothetical protein
MASGTYQQPSPGATQSAESERFVVGQLARAGRYLKMMELFGSLMVLGIGVLLFLLAVVVVDAWVFELGFWARLVVLMVLAAGSLAYFALVMLPLLVHRINPAYAARTIEKSEPALKNSLINFLSFRTHRGEVHQVVYDALEQRAAVDLSHTQVESVVNHTRLVRIGYVLAGLLVVCGLYTVLSPKKPFATLQRILAPSAEIARPSVVQILDVDPGDATVFHSDRVKVSARVEGLPSDTPVTLYYSTADGKTVDVAVQMALDGTRYTAELPPNKDGLAGGGIQQDARYRIVAGDARTPEYRLHMLPAPRMNVTGVEYDYPDYTRLPDRIADGEADIQAPEGTRVTIRARANQPIKAAYIELNPLPDENPIRSPRLPNTVPMQASEAEAHGTILLDLQADRLKPRHHSYQVRFVTEAGHRSRQPTVHRIEVTRDLEPEVEILSPKRNHIQVPVDGRQTIEVRAIDPDYGLSRVALKATVRDEALLDQALLEDAAGKTGQVVRSYEFVPAALRLEAGTRVMLWATAADNRTAPAHGMPEPNVARTENYLIEIVAAERPRGDAATPPEMEKSEPSESTTGESMGEKSSEGSREGSRDGSGGEGSKSSAGETSEGSNTESGGGGEGSSGGSSGMGDTSESGGGGNSGNKSEGASEGSRGGGESGDGSGASGAQGESSEGSEGGSASSEGAASGERTEPLHDGEVFERAMEHQKEKNGGGSDSSDGAGAENSNTDGSDGGNNNSQNANGSNAGQNNAGQNNGGDQNSGGAQNNGGANNGGQKDEGQKNDGQNSGGQNSGGQNSAGQNNAGQNSGGANNGNNSPMPGGEKPGSQGSAGQGGNQQPMPGEGQPGEGQPGEGQSGNAGQNSAGQENAGQNNAGSQGNPSEGGGESGSQSSGSQGDMKDPQGGGSQQPSGGTQGGDMKQPSQSGSGGDQASGGSQQGEKPGDKPKPGEGGASGQNPVQPKPGSGGSGGSEPMNGQQNPSGGEGSTPMEGGTQKSGAGQQGAGDGGRQPGEGNAGGGQSSDEGSGSAPEKGSGETSGRGGTESQPTGRTGDSKQGDGSGGNASGNKQPGASGQGGNQGEGGGQSSTEQTQNADPSQAPERPDGERPNSEVKDESGSSGASRTSSGASGSNTSKSGDSSGTSRPSGAGSPSSGKGNAGSNPRPKAPEGEAPEADKANLEYTKQATDLALEYLKDQKSKPDPELLEKLNMTEKELAEFVDRWEAMKSKSREGDAAGRDYTDALRSLGLRPGQDVRRSVGAADDQVFGADSGARSEPPPGYAEQFRYFKSGRAGGDRE